ncbi:MAG TPA: FAD-dependent oxidoreductase [Thermoanaerobaculia bacterium]|jgi:ferredoxin--NADP+ reductase|nr:MAG: NADPH-ferredoxin reductase FprA [Acidobacteria bacterium ADurb.Bin051]HNU82769.1 FAD-dependent oxidoreductase [Thermoanaerobaculia bacterium]HPA96779.1 FAD-dependent oxidoreductase [Thermoanaerobaculia bacterium]
MTSEQTQVPLRVAVVGSGPAGFYAAETLLRSPETAAEVDLFDRLPTPYGLVRGGVAPDHQKIKSVTRIYERTAARPSFRFLGNVQLGRDLLVDDLRAHYHQIVYATGNEADRRLGIPGEGVTGSTPSAVFVGWYNGHPDFREARIRLDTERAVVVGNGNVAVDVTRILLRTPDELAATDLAGHALAALRESRVREVWMLGRRGPAQAAFTPQELKELGELTDVDIVVDPAALELDSASAAAVAESASRARNLELLREFAARPRRGAGRVLHLRFGVSPVEILVDDEERVRGLVVARNRLEARSDGSVAARPTGETETLEAGLVLAAIGYAGEPIPGVPFDPKARVIANVEGRVCDPETREIVPREYVVGWARTGPQGLIGSHKGGSAEVVERMLADWRTGQIPAAALPPRPAIDELLAGRGVQVVGFSDWKRLDDVEVARGARRGAPREKFSDLESMLALLGE